MLRTQTSWVRFGFSLWALHVCVPRSTHSAAVMSPAGRNRWPTNKAAAIRRALLFVRRTFRNFFSIAHKRQKGGKHPPVNQRVRSFIRIKRIVNNEKLRRLKKYPIYRCFHFHGPARLYQGNICMSNVNVVRPSSPFFLEIATLRKEIKVVCYSVKFDLNINERNYNVMAVTHVAAEKVQNNWLRPYYTALCQGDFISRIFNVGSKYHSCHAYRGNIRVSIGCLATAESSNLITDVLGKLQGVNMCMKIYQEISWNFFF